MMDPVLDVAKIKARITNDNATSNILSLAFRK